MQMPKKNLPMNKVIYLVKSYKCSACKLQKVLLYNVLKGYSDIELKECYLEEVPDEIVYKIPIGTYPITVFTKDNKVLLSYVGTMIEDRIKNVMKTINY